MKNLAAKGYSVLPVNHETLAVTAAAPFQTVQESCIMPANRFG